MRLSAFSLIVFVVAGFFVIQKAPTKTFVFRCETSTLVVHTIQSEDEKVHREKSSYLLDYAVDFGNRESYTVLSARIERHTNDKTWVYETGKEGEPKASGLFFETFRNKPLILSSDERQLTNTPEEIPFFKQAEKNIALQTLSFALSVSLRHKDPWKERNDKSSLPLSPLGELLLCLSYREAGKMREGKRWEILLERIEFLPNEHLKGVIKVEIKEPNMSGWALYDDDGFLITARLSYRLKLILSQCIPSHFCSVESSAVSSVVIERR
ncbi:MAG: hypothetical protein N2234_05965 [Planctomycetota bacterium]|nr:hypothetical protein [Planctomycetota bacterium]